MKFFGAHESTLDIGWLFGILHIFAAVLSSVHFVVLSHLRTVCSNLSNSVHLGRTVNSFRNFAAEQKHVQSMGKLPTWYKSCKESFRNLFEELLVCTSIRFCGRMPFVEDSWFISLWWGTFSQTVTSCCSNGWCRLSVVTNVMRDPNAINKRL